MGRRISKGGRLCSLHNFLKIAGSRIALQALGYKRVESSSLSCPLGFYTSSGAVIRAGSTGGGNRGENGGVGARVRLPKTPLLDKKGKLINA